MSTPRRPRVLVIGLDGLEPTIVEAMLQAGELPALASIRARGGYSRLATSFPAQTPVAWSSFATGSNPGGHGIYDFLRRDPATYLPDLALNRYEQKNAFTPPRVVNRRGGEPFWDLLAKAGVPATILRCPCTYPGEIVAGRLLSGMGVPDIRGGLGTPTVWTEDTSVTAGESERIIHIALEDGVARTLVPGPRIPKGEASVPLTIRRTGEATATVELERGSPVELVAGEGAWSEWQRLKFKLGLFQSVAGNLRFLLVRGRPLTLYASPVNFAPDAPLFPISAPADYAGALEKVVGTYYTTGMVEDHTGLMNGRIDEHAFLTQCAVVMREREAMLQHELARLDAGVLFCLFDTPDRLQHMFWRFGEPGHPANREGFDPAFSGMIRSHYRECDAVVARALEHLTPDDLVLVASDHGFGSFQRGIHLNAWLHQHGYLALRHGVEPGEAAGEMLRQVDWDRTRAFAVGLGSVYLNRRGREAGGILDDAEAAATAEEIARRLAGLTDEARGVRAVERVLRREEIYRGAFLDEAPDLLVCASPGYRASWATGLGGVPAALFEDNVRRWGGDHIIDPAHVPGVLFMSEPFAAGAASLVDLAPTILASFGVAPGPAMEGRNLLAGEGSQLAAAS